MSTYQKACKDLGFKPRSEAAMAEMGIYVHGAFSGNVLAKGGEGLDPNKPKEEKVTASQRDKAGVGAAAPVRGGLVVGGGQAGDLQVAAARASEAVATAFAASKGPTASSRERDERRRVRARRRVAGVVAKHVHISNLLPHRGKGALDRLLLSLIHI